MRFAVSAAALAVIAGLWGTATTGLTLSQAASPAETPPADFSKDVFVDSRGCVYVRASIGSTVNWVPRLSRDRKSVICGMTPSAAVASSSAPPPAPPAPPPPAPPAPLPAPLPASVPAALPAAAAPVAAPVSEPAPQPAAAPAPTAPAGFVRSVDVTCPADGTPLRVTVGGDSVRVNCPAGMSRSAAYIVTHGDGSRSRLVTHPAAAKVAQAAPGGSVVIGNRAPGTPNTAFGNGYGFSHDAPPVDPVPSVTAPAPKPPVRPRRGPFEVTPSPDAPPPAMPKGYRPAWDDDRLNPYRGPQGGYGSAQTAPAPAAPVSGKRYVQVGAFRKSGNASKAVANIHGLGMHAATSRTRSGLTQVLAGPFASQAELQRALSTLRSHYPDAYTRS